MDVLGRRLREPAAVSPEAGRFLIKLLSDEQGEQPINHRDRHVQVGHQLEGEAGSVSCEWRCVSERPVPQLPRLSCPVSICTCL